MKWAGRVGDVHSLGEGLLTGEVVLLTVKDFGLEHGEIGFYRAKVDRGQRLKISDKTTTTAQVSTLRPSAGNENH